MYTQGLDQQGKAQEGPRDDESAERLAAFCEAGGCNALNLRLHLTGLGAERIRDQLEALGADVLPALKGELRP